MMAAPTFPGRVADTITGLSRRYTFGFAAVLTVGLLVANLLRDKGGFGLTSQLADFAPLALAGMASTPAILSGGGGFDLSIAPLMNMLSAAFVIWLVPAGLGGAVAVPLVMLMGAAIGLMNGLVIVGLRVTPIVATLASYFILIGVNDAMVSNPASVSTTWLSHLAGSVGPIPGAIFTIGLPLVIWVGLSFIPYRRLLYAVGSNDATAYASGVNVNAIRVAAYGLGGMFAGVGALSLIAVSLSADASQATTYTLVGVAAVALGGTSFRGGRGGLLGSALGAAALYLLGTLLVTLQINPSLLQVMYGGMLVVAVIFTSVGAKVKAAT